MVPVIDFRNYKIKEINFKSIDSKSKDDNKDSYVERKVQASITEDKLKAILNLKVDITDLKRLRSISVEIDGFFDIKEGETIENIKEYLSINGVAILYPYIRSIVSMITSLDSPQALILPTINTTQI